ncbi:Myosin-6 [Symbiodinium microadriaticum]|uniref:Myosin-6 n=1 Tax=Symbiodinium microadriaticum TaxID=2951 RepID=A0A1Q9CCB3_SYMMI|nr:Myosin-6 [Symbiodinium microadriaticum]
MWIKGSGLLALELLLGRRLVRFHPSPCKISGSKWKAGGLNEVWEKQQAAINAEEVRDLMLQEERQKAADRQDHVLPAPPSRKSTGEHGMTALAKSVLFGGAEGHWFWCWCLAALVEGNYIVVDDQGSKFEVPQEKARPVDPNCLKGVEDLLSLGDFNEGALLHNVNPFQNLAGLYSEAKQKFYRDRSAAAGASGDESDLPPHLFSVAAAAYTTMLSDARNQSIIISGESGAGKTEATKRILTYFANLQRSGSAVHEKMSIEEQVLRSNPILEAFGNVCHSEIAKTIRNDNSSRFGKFIDIELLIFSFDSSGKLQSARISNYLLEKSRIVKQQPDERGYHVCTDIPGVDDAGMFEEAVECMDGLGFSTEEKNSVFQLVAAVVHLGDMQFEEGDDGSRICDAVLAAKMCELLQVSKEAFTNTFQYRTMEDPFSKKMINMPQDATKKIGILDIYGFEVFEWNSFEQLCINFANEKLQQHFNSHMFTLEQRLYAEEGISWSHIQWKLGGKIYNTFKNSKVYKPSRFASTNFAVQHYAGEVLSFLEYLGLHSLNLSSVG